MRLSNAAVLTFGYRLFGDGRLFPQGFLWVFFGEGWQKEEEEE